MNKFFSIFQKWEIKIKQYQFGQKNVKLTPEMINIIPKKITSIIKIFFKSTHLTTFFRSVGDIPHC